MIYQKGQIVPDDIVHQTEPPIKFGCKVFVTRNDRGIEVRTLEDGYFFQAVENTELHLKPNILINGKGYKIPFAVVSSLL